MADLPSARHCWPAGFRRPALAELTTVTAAPHNGFSWRSINDGTTSESAFLRAPKGTMDEDIKHSMSTGLAVAGFAVASFGASASFFGQEHKVAGLVLILVSASWAVGCWVLLRNRRRAGVGALFLGMIAMIGGATWIARPAADEQVVDDTPTGPAWCDCEEPMGPGEFPDPKSSYPRFPEKAVVEATPGMPSGGVHRLHYKNDSDADFRLLVVDCALYYENAQAKLPENFHWVAWSFCRKQLDVFEQFRPGSNWYCLFALRESSRVPIPLGAWNLAQDDEYWLTVSGAGSDPKVTLVNQNGTPQ